MKVEHACKGPGFYYLATPYSKFIGGIGAAYRQACVIGAELIRRGVPVFSPIAHSHSIALHGGIDPHDHSIWLPADQPMIDAARGVIVAKMVGWDESTGVKFEIEAFRRAGKPIFMLDAESFLCAAA